MCITTKYLHVFNLKALQMLSTCHIVQRSLTAVTDITASKGTNVVTQVNDDM